MAMRFLGAVRFSILGLVCVLSACGGSDDESGDKASNGAALDKLLRGPEATSVDVIHPAFLNGPDSDQLATSWVCDAKLGEDQLTFRFAFAADRTGLAFGKDGSSVTAPLSWRLQGNTFAFRVAELFRIDFVDVDFDSDTTFNAVFYVSTSADFELDSNFVTDPPSSNTVRCHLAPAEDGDPLKKAPFQTSEGPASWPRPDPVKMEPVPILSRTFVTYRLTYDGGTPNYSWSSRVGFDDGTYTTSISRLLELGIEGSRAQYPKSWGEWRRGDEGGFEFRSDSNSEFERARNVTSQTRPKVGKTVDGCFGSSSSYTVGGLFGNTTRLSNRRFCFSSDGVFTHGSSTTATSPDVIAGSGRSDAGTYRLDGFLIELTYGDGRKVATLFSTDGGTAVVGSGTFLQGL